MGNHNISGLNGTKMTKEVTIKGDKFMVYVFVRGCFVNNGDGVSVTPPTGATTPSAEIASASPPSQTEKTPTLLLLQPKNDLIHKIYFRSQCFLDKIVSIFLTALLQLLKVLYI